MGGAIAINEQKMKPMLKLAAKIEKEGKLSKGSFNFIMFYVTTLCRREEGRSCLKKHMEKGIFRDMQGVPRIGMRVVLKETNTATFRFPEQIVTRH